MTATAAGCARRTLRHAQPGLGWRDIELYLAIPDAEFLQRAALFDDRRSALEIRRGNALVTAASRGELERVRFLLAQGIDADARFISVGSCDSGYSALILATSSGHAEVVRLLLRHGVDIDYQRDGRSALFQAYNFDHDDIAALLLAAGAGEDPAEIKRRVIEDREHELSLGDRGTLPPPRVRPVGYMPGPAERLDSPGRTK
ncbi:MAG: ankyrin repeat domain-containing protein [Planctomycetota bacterium]